MFDYLLHPLIRQFSGVVAVAYYDFRSGQSYSYRADQPMRAASLIKVPILLCALKQGLDLNRRFELAAEDKVFGAGVLQFLGAGLGLSFHDLLTLMIIVSDNTATNMVIDIVGQDLVNAYISKLGLKDTCLVGKLQLPEHKQNANQLKGMRNHTSAQDMLSLLVRLEQRQLLPEKETTVALDILKKQQFTEAMSRYLPRDAELSENYVVVASKSGCLRGLWHDAGIVYNRENKPLYALVVMTDQSQDMSYSWEQEGMMLIANISKSLFRNT